MSLNPGSELSEMMGMGGHSLRHHHDLLTGANTWAHWIRVAISMAKVGYWGQVGATWGSAAYDSRALVALAEVPWLQ